MDRRISEVTELLKIKNETDIAEIYISGDIVDDEEGGWLSDWRGGKTTGYEFPTKLKKNRWRYI